MNKLEAIDSVIELQKQSSRALVSYVFEHWQKLDVPLAQLKSLFIITTRQGTNSRSLAKDLGVTPGNVTGLVNRLVEQELVIRKPDSSDRRITWLEATEKGRNLLTSLVDTQSRLTLNILQQMNQEDLLALSQGMRGFMQVVESINTESYCPAPN